MKFKLEIIVFLCGAVVMILELAGSRLLAPYIGTSLFVWTSLIGIILGSLSIGYWYGGVMADRYPLYSRMALILIAASLFIGLIGFVQGPFLAFLTQNVADIRISSILATIILFSIPSILLGMISPYAVKLKLHNLQTSGVSVGSLYALSTLGSIVGTFLAGFVLIALIGSTSIIFLLSFILFLLSIIADHKLFSRNLFSSLGLGSFLLMALYINPVNSQSVIDIDTDYSRVWITDARDQSTDKDVRTMRINSEYNSGAFIDSDELYFEYSKYYNLADYFTPNYKQTLMIGGAGFSYPTYLLNTKKDVSIDVVEIDPMMTILAKKYFKLKDNPRLTIYNEDGRTFLNNNKKKYDVVYGDAFKSLYSIPFQLATKEAIQKIYDSLNEDGVLVINLISSIDGDKSKIFRSEYATFKSVFPNVYAFAVTNPEDKLNIHNIMLVGHKSDKLADLKSSDSTIQSYLDNQIILDEHDTGIILTDDFAPIDSFTSEFLH